MTGVPASRSGYSPFGLSLSSQSQAQPSIPNARIERVRKELERLRREAIDADTGAARFGPDCKGCRYSDTGAPLYCKHPSVQKVSVDWRGKVSMEGSKRARDMRADDGLCGPEAVMFERRQLHRRVPWFALAGVAWIAFWPLVFGGLASPLSVFGFLGILGEWAFGRWA